MMTPWPTMNAVEAADRDQCREWANTLPRPVTDEQVAIVRRACQRMVELSAYTAPKFIPMPEAAPASSEATAVKPIKKTKPAPAAKPEAAPLSNADFFAALKSR